MEQNKMRYVNEVAKEGSLVAFRSGDKMLSGMIVNIYSETGRFDVKTKNSKMFAISKDDVAWVKTGKRWPKGIYLALRGEVTNGNEGNECRQ